MKNYVETKGIYVPETQEDWRSVNLMSLSDLTKLEADRVGRATARLMDFHETMPGEFIYDLRNGIRAEVSQDLSYRSYDLDEVRELLNSSIGQEIMIGGYHPVFKRFQVHFLDIDGQTYLN